MTCDTSNSDTAMPMSDYVRGLRQKIGTTVLEIPTVSVLTFDDDGRVLLVRHVEGNDWTTPGGMIEPYETPSNAAVREMWEETGLLVSLTRIVGVFGGELCASTYSNGDRVSWVSTVFQGRPVGGVLKPDGEEALDARYFAREQLAALECKPHVEVFLNAAWSSSAQAYFQPPTWKPGNKRC
jgi:8-oxo-dGTP pyrophosphatase MutT (NUDIX family)